MFTTQELRTGKIFKVYGTTTKKDINGVSSVYFLIRYKDSWMYVPAECFVPTENGDSCIGVLDSFGSGAQSKKFHLV